MEALTYLLFPLGCAAMMGGMMWMMGRGRGDDDKARSRPEEIDALREEIATLRDSDRQRTDG